MTPLQAAKDAIKKLKSHVDEWDYDSEEEKEFFQEQAREAKKRAALLERAYQASLKFEKAQELFEDELKKLDDAYTFDLMDYIPGYALESQELDDYWDVKEWLANPKGFKWHKEAYEYASKELSK